MYLVSSRRARVHVAIIGLCAAPVAAGEPAAFQPLVDLSGGATHGSAYGISADGLTVVGEGSDANGQRAVRWTHAGVPEAIAAPFSSAWHCSADGSVVVGTFIQPPRVFRWTSSSGAVLLGDLPGGIEWSAGLNVSNDGAVVVGMSNSSTGYEAYRWTAAGGMQGLGDLPGGTFGSEARGLSADGSVIVGQGQGAAGPEAFRWTASNGMVALGDLPGGSFSSAAIDVNSDGSVIVGLSSSAASGSASEPIRWTEGDGMVGLGDLPGGATNGYAFGVSDDGSIVVGFSEASLGEEAFVWDEANGMRNLRTFLEHNGIDMTGWVLRVAYDVSADGTRIAGWGRNPDGNEQAWVAVLPEPAGAVVIGSLLWAMLGRRRRARRTVGSD